MIRALGVALETDEQGAMGCVLMYAQAVMLVGRTTGQVPREGLELSLGRLRVEALERVGLWKDGAASSWRREVGLALAMADRRAEFDRRLKAVRRRLGRPSGPCAIGCGRPGTTWDHVVPMVKGGNDDPSNLQPMCGPCNSKKGAR